MENKFTCFKCGEDKPHHQRSKASSFTVGDITTAASLCKDCLIKLLFEKIDSCCKRDPETCKYI